LRSFAKPSTCHKEELAKILDVEAANVSKIERREDMRLSTLVTYIRAMGGDIEIIATSPTAAGQGQDHQAEAIREDTSDAA